MCDLSAIYEFVEFTALSVDVGGKIYEHDSGVLGKDGEGIMRDFGFIRAFGESRGGGDSYPL